MAIGDYTATTYVNGTTPALNATNLNHAETKIGELDSWAASIIPAGSTIMYAGSSAPAGWLMCDGSAVSRTTYSTLYTAIGTGFGSGDGSTTFNLPDMRAAAPAGVGTSAGYTQNETVALGTKYNDQLQGFKTQNGTLPNYNGQVNPTGGSGGYVLVTSGGSVLTFSPITDGTNGTPRTGTATRGKLVGINFIIKI